MRTWAKRGQTPIVRHHLTRDHLSAICALVQNGRHKGRLLVQVRDKAFCGQSMIGFLLHLLRHLKGKLLVIWDGAPIHRAQAVKDFLTQGGAARVHLEQLLAYAPEVNPDEGIWSYLKRVELRNVCCDDLPELRRELRLAAVRLRHKRKALRGCIIECGYATE